MNNDLTLVKEAMDVYRPFPVSTKNVGQVLATIITDNSLGLTELINRIVIIYGGSRLGAICKVAQSFLACKATINDFGTVEVYRG